MYTFIGLVFVITALFSLNIWMRASHNRSLGAAAITALAVFFLIGQSVPKDVIRSTAALQALLGFLLLAHIGLVAYWIYVNARINRSRKK